MGLSWTGPFLILKRLIFLNFKILNFQSQSKDTQMTLIEVALVSSILKMLLFAGEFSKATTLRNCEKWLYLNIWIFKGTYGAVPI